MHPCAQPPFRSAAKECQPPARALDELRIRYRLELPDHRAEEEDQVGLAGDLAFEEHVTTLQMTAVLPPANAQVPWPGLLGHSTAVELQVVLVLGLLRMPPWIGHRGRAHRHRLRPAA